MEKRSLITAPTNEQTTEYRNSVSPDANMFDRHFATNSRAISQPAVTKPDSQYQHGRDPLISISEHQYGLTHLTSKKELPQIKKKRTLRAKKDKDDKARTTATMTMKAKAEKPMWRRMSDATALTDETIQLFELQLQAQ